MAVNKVIYNTENGERVLIDLTSDTVTPETLAEGVTAHNARGNKITGTMPSSSIPKAAKIKYIIPATYIPKRTSDDNGFDNTVFTFTRENVNQLCFADWRLQDETVWASSGIWVQDIMWSMLYQGNYQGQHNLVVTWLGAGNKGNNNSYKVGNIAKTSLTVNFSVGNHTTTDANYKRWGTLYKGLIFIYDSTYNGAPMVDETKLTQYFTNCNGQLTAGM